MSWWHGVASGAEGLGAGVIDESFLSARFVLPSNGAFISPTWITSQYREFSIVRNLIQYTGDGTRDIGVELTYTISTSGSTAHLTGGQAAVSIDVGETGSGSRTPILAASVNYRNPNPNPNPPRTHSSTGRINTNDTIRVLFNSSAYNSRASVNISNLSLRITAS